MVKDSASRIRDLEHQRAESEKIAATGRMAARIAYEINNPLAGIKNSFLLLRAIMDKEQPHCHYADMAQKEVDRNGHIIRKMFDLYRPDTRERMEACVDETIRDVTGIMDSALRGKRGQGCVRPALTAGESRTACGIVEPGALQSATECAGSLGVGGTP